MAVVPEPMSEAGGTTSLLDAALDAEAAGLSVLPPKQDGTKAPDADGWKRYQVTRATEDEVRRWYANGRSGLGVVCGAVSGGLEMFEFEGRAVEAGMADLFIDAAEECGLGDLVGRIALGYTEATPSGGLHWLVRTTSPVTTKLARRPATEEELAEDPDNRVKPLIETKGEGGFTITAPSYGAVHPTGGQWTLVSGGFANIATVTAEEQQALHDLARSFDQMPRPAVKDERTKGAAPFVADVRPGDDFNARTGWAEVLEPDGWTAVYTRGDTTYWRRPGKSAGISATTGHGGSDLLWVFSSSTPFEPERSYDRFGAYAVLHHGGDLSLAAQMLAEQSYGRSEHGARQHGGGDHPRRVDDGVEGPDLDQSWPMLDGAALHGLAGDVVETLDPHTEADPAAVLVSFLVAFGTAVNAAPHAIADGAEHPGRLFAVLVGATSRGRKGTAWANVRRVLAVADPGFTSERILGGLASGEGLIAAVSDGTTDKDGNVVGAIADKRLLVYEPEFARVLKVCARDSSTLSAILRDSWDRGDLRVMTRKDPIRATGAHIGLLAHVTVEELRRSLLESDAANGYGNRHLFIGSRRSKRLPSGGNLDESEVLALGARVRRALDAARNVGIMRRSPDAEVLWEQIYNAIDDDLDGMAGALGARAEAQMLRLSVVYALTDGSPVIGIEHLRAAQAVWRYSEATIAHVYGDSSGDEVADRLLAAIRRAGEGGLTRQSQSAVFGRNISSDRLGLARRLLERKSLVVTTEGEHSGGRPRTVSYAVNAGNGKSVSGG